MGREGLNQINLNDRIIGEVRTYSIDWLFKLSYTVYLKRLASFLFSQKLPKYQNTLIFKHSIIESVWFTSVERISK